MWGRTISLLTVMAAVVWCGVPAQGQAPQFLISCEGTESGGGGATQYQYEVKNNTANPLLLQQLLIGTDDGVLANYQNIVSPAGFAFSLILNNTTFWTTTVKTAHGGMVPNQQWVRMTQNVIQWSSPGGVMLGPGQSVVFGFNNANSSQDVEWVARNLQGASTLGVPTSPVAGPLGVFTDGPVHSPVPEPGGLLMLALGGMALLRRR